MADGTFTIRANVTDNASPALKNIQARIAQLGKGGNLTPLGREMAALDKSLTGFTSRLQETVQIFGRVAISATAIGLAFYAIGRAVSKVADDTQALGKLSRQTGMATNEIKAFSLAAQSMGISKDEAVGALSFFAAKVEDLRINFKGLNSELLAAGGGEFLTNLVNTKDPLQRVLLTVRQIRAVVGQNVEWGRKLSKEMFGSETFWELEEKRITSLLGRHKALTKEQLAAAAEYKLQWLLVGDAVSSLKSQIIRQLMPGMTHILKQFDELLMKGGNDPDVMKFVKELNEALLRMDIKPGITAFFKEVMSTIKTDLKDLELILKIIEKLESWTPAKLSNKLLNSLRGQTWLP